MFEIGQVVGFVRQTEGARVNVVGNEVSIGISYFSPSQQEVDAFNNEPIEIGVMQGLNCLLFGYRIGNNSWQDLLYSYPYSYYLASKKEDIFVEPTVEFLRADEPLILKMYLMNSDTKQIIGKRIFTLTSEMKKEVANCLKTQKHSIIPFLESTDLEDAVSFHIAIKNFIDSQDINRMSKNFKKCVCTA